MHKKATRLSIVFRQSIKKHLIEFELHIKLLLFHTNAGTDMYVRLKSARTRASSGVELRVKLHKMLCTPPRKKTSRALKANFCQHLDDLIFVARTHATLLMRQVLISLNTHFLGVCCRDTNNVNATITVSLL